MAWNRLLPLCLLFSCLTGALAAADRTILLSGDVYELNPGPLLDYLRDPTGRLTIEDVADPRRAGDWQASDRDVLNFGFDATVIWVRLRLVDRSVRPGDWYLELENPGLDYIQFYQSRDGGMVVRRAGDQLPFGAREIKHRMFVFRLRTGPAPTEVYIRLQSAGGTSMPFLIRSHASLTDHIEQEQLILGAYYGLMGIMIVYNISLFFSMRSSVYLVYALYISSYMLLFLIWNGLAFQYFWPARPWWNMMAPLAIIAIHLTSLQFTRGFLETAAHAPRFDRVMRLQIWCGPLLALAGLFLPRLTFNMAVAVYTALVIVTMILVGGLTLLRGVRAARFYAGAVGVVLLSAFVSLLVILGLVEVNFWTRFANQIGTAIEVALLSIALGDRINVIRKERESARAEALASRWRTDQLKDQFLSNISHELRTPLAEIFGYAEILSDEQAGIREDLRPMVTAVHRASGQLAELIQDLMLLTSLDADLDMEADRIPLAELVEDCLKGLRETISSKGIAVVTRRNDEPIVRGDPSLLGKVCYHLLKNAVLYNRDGGLVEVDIRAEAGRARIDIRDTGIGIPGDDLTRIFEKFYRVDSSLTYSVPGVGLGLFVVRRILDLHSGHITVRSESGQGSVFSIFLPALAVPADRSHVA